MAAGTEHISLSTRRRPTAAAALPIADIARRRQPYILCGMAKTNFRTFALERAPMVPIFGAT